MHKDSTLTVAEVGLTVTLRVSSTRYTYRGVAARKHTCKRPTPLQRGDVVVVQDRMASSVLVRRTEGPCRCPFLLYDPVPAEGGVEGSSEAPARRGGGGMAKIHWLREDEPPSEGTLAAARDWAWCMAHLGNLSYLSPPDRLPTLYPDKDDRPDLAPFRGRQYVLVKLEEAQGGYKAGYYKSSISPQQLAEKL